LIFGIASRDAQNPTFDFGDGPLWRRQVRVEKSGEPTGRIGLAQPRGDRVGIMLVGSAAVRGE
jgi:hypothetical protein